MTERRSRDPMFSLPGRSRVSGRRRRATTVLATILLLGAMSDVGLADPPRGQAGAAAGPSPAAGVGGRAPRAGEARARARLLEGFDPRRHRLEGGLRVADLAGGRRAVLTLDAGLQAHLVERLAHYEVPYAAVVAVEPASGRLLAYVSHSSDDPAAGDIVLDPTPPAASVFKIITGAALLDAGVGADTRVCYGGGASRLLEVDLRDDPRRDTACATMSDAMGRSINSVFAKLADRHLNVARLSRYASAFGFGHALPFDVVVRASAMEVPSDRLEFARTSAGFWHMHMSPLHGAAIAATIANDGVMPRMSMIDRIEEADGRVVHRHRPEAFRSVIPRATARSLGEMMQRTTRGTARGAFFDPQGVPFLPGIAIAGKTGTLTAESPYRGYTWWVGFAPSEQPTVAVAVLVVNSPRWRIKASYMAREALRYYLVQRPRDLARGG